MKPADWKMMSYIGIGLGFLLLAIGGWIWLNVEGYMGWQGWLEYFEYRNYLMTLFIMGIIFLVVGFAFGWRAQEERKLEVETQKPSYASLKKCPICGTKFSLEYEYCPACGVTLESA